MNNYYLVLETGEVFPGRSHSQQFFERAGEVVFNTSHSGFQEVATDPSYFSQIIVMTAPMQGNYGFQSEASESNKIWVEGFVCLSIQNTTREKSWLEHLEQNKVSILSDIDTRKLVMRLRSAGTPWGAFVEAPDQVRALEKAKKLIDKNKQLPSDWVFEATCKEKQVHRGELLVGPRLGILDFGMKQNILREAMKRSTECFQFPARTCAEEILAHQLDGLILSNGPGDPDQVQIARETIKDLLGKIPLFGICMGHQILALALGAKTYKLKFGHRGSNHPIRDELLGQIYMTSQNHGYAVDKTTLPNDVLITHTNLNDLTVAGIFSEKLKCLGVQFHPESCPGPHDSVGLFDFFTQKML